MFAAFGMVGSTNNLLAVSSLGLNVVDTVVPSSNPFPGWANNAIVWTAKMQVIMVLCILKANIAGCR